jgi:hypothetical protein
LQKELRAQASSENKHGRYDGTMNSLVERGYNVVGRCGSSSLLQVAGKKAIVAAVESDRNPRYEHSPVQTTPAAARRAGL